MNGDCNKNRYSLNYFIQKFLTQMSVIFFDQYNLRNVKVSKLMAILGVLKIEGNNETNI